MTTPREVNQHAEQINLIAQDSPVGAIGPRKRGRKSKSSQPAPVIKSAQTTDGAVVEPEKIMGPVTPVNPDTILKANSVPESASIEPDSSAQVACNAVIKVIGVGGGGGNAVSHMIKSGLSGVEFIVANTDVQAIRNTGAARQLQIGRHVTKHLGAGLVPETGRQAALEDKELILEALQGADMVFIAAGMGGGTGTGAAPVIAQLAKELDILTVAIVTRPFSFEGKKKMQVALGGIKELALHCDSLITIPNDKILSIPGRKVGFLEAFRVADDVLLDAVRGIYDLIVRPGLMNVDFADVRTVMGETSLAMMGTGRASGDDRAQAALEAAIQNPLLDDINISGATGILVNIVAGPDFGAHEYGEIGHLVDTLASEDAFTKTGFVLDPDMKDEIQVTVIATGLNRNTATSPERGPQQHKAPVIDDTVLRVRPKVELVRSQRGQRDGTTGMWLENPMLEAASGDAVVTQLRAHMRNEVISESPKTALSGHDAYLDTNIDIPAFLRRQCD